MPLVGSFLAGAYLGFGGSGLFLLEEAAGFSSLEEELLCEEETGFSSLEDAAEEAGFSTLEELPVLSEVPFEEEEAGFSSLEEGTGLSSLEEADVSSLEEAGLSSLEEAVLPAKKAGAAGGAGRCTADRKFQLVAGDGAVIIAGGA